MRFSSLPLLALVVCAGATGFLWRSAVEANPTLFSLRGSAAPAAAVGADCGEDHARGEVLAVPDPRPVRPVSSATRTTTTAGAAQRPGPGENAPEDAADPLSEGEDEAAEAVAPEDPKPAAAAEPPRGKSSAKRGERPAHPDTQPPNEHAKKKTKKTKKTKSKRPAADHAQASKGREKGTEPPEQRPEGELKPREKDEAGTTDGKRAPPAPGPPDSLPEKARAPEDGPPAEPGPPASPGRSGR